MRHYYFRLILGGIFIACAVFCLVTLNIPFAIFFAAFGGAMLYSANVIWKKKKDNK